jgi:hypothetical protein
MVHLQHLAKGAFFISTPHGPDFGGNFGFDRLINPLCIGVADERKIRNKSWNYPN